MTHMIESHLVLTHAPLSIMDFSLSKNNPDEVEGLDCASLYVIAKREMPLFSINKELSSAKLIALNVVMKKAEAKLQIYIPTEGNEKYALEGFAGINGLSMRADSSDTDMERTSNEYYISKTPDSVLSSLEFEAFDIHAYQKSGDESSIKVTCGLNFNELIYYASHGYLCIAFHGDLLPFITYDVLYIGQCTGEPLTKRFNGHHALQDILIKEKAISSDMRNSEELVLMPFRSEADTISVITGNTSEEDFIKAFTNNFSFGMKEVNLDCEKALVHGMLPAYNKIKFEKYPKSRDGLYGTEAEVYAYSICEDLILKYKDGMVYGNIESALASMIVGDKSGFAHIYMPGENFTQRYVEEMFPYPPYVNNMKDC